MKELILAGTWQFGHSSGTTTICKALREDYVITYISFDQGKPKIILSDVVTDYVVEETKNRIVRKYKFLRMILEYIAKADKNVVIHMTYFRFCCIVPILFPFRKIVLDHRSGNINPNRLNRGIKNTLMWFETFFFSHIASISVELKHHLKLPKKTIVFPLGSDIISTTNKSYEVFNLLYVGTLQGRQIHETIYGIAEFTKKYPNVPITYSIIGKGDNSLILNEIKKHELEKVVKLHGFVPNDEIVQYYNSSNIGICYAPMTSFYMPQPFSKLYEYTLSGMAVISVKLLDSVRRVNDNNGVLCDDNAKSFAEALERIYLNRENYDSEKIRQEFLTFSWKELSKQFKTIIDD